MVAHLSRDGCASSSARDPGSSENDNKGAADCTAIDLHSDQLTTKATVLLELLDCAQGHAEDDALVFVRGDGRMETCSSGPGDSSQHGRLLLRVAHVNPMACTLLDLGSMGGAAGRPTAEQKYASLLASPSTASSHALLGTLLRFAALIADHPQLQATQTRGSSGAGGILGIISPLRHEPLAGRHEPPPSNSRSAAAASFQTMDAMARSTLDLEVCRFRRSNGRIAHALMVHHTTSPDETRAIAAADSAHSIRDASPVSTEQLDLLTSDSEPKHRKLLGCNSPGGVLAGTTTETIIKGQGGVLAGTATETIKGQGSASPQTSIGLTLLDDLPIMVTLCDVDDGRVLYQVRCVESTF